MASVFTNNVEGCLDAVYEDIIYKHSDMIDDEEEFTEETFSEFFNERIHDEIDSTVNEMSNSDVNAIIEEIGWIKLVRIYREVYGNLDGLFDESDNQIKGKLIYQSLYESVMEKKTFESYMEYFKAEYQPENEADDFNLRNEEGERAEGEEETDSEGEGEGEETEEDE